MTAGRGENIRRLAGLALGLQAVYLASWLVAGVLEPGYSAVDSFVSELAAKDAERRWVVTVGLVASGLSLLALAAGLALALPRARLALATLGVAGVAILAAAALPLDCMATADAACEAAVRAGDVSGTHWGHFAASVVAQLALVATPFALARALWSRPAGLLALQAGVAGLAVGLVVNALTWDLAEGAGYAQRLGILTVLLLVVFVAAGLLNAARPEPAEAPLTPLRPRGFFHRHWTGSGEIVLWPRWLWRRWPLRFTAVRELDVTSDELFVFHDRAEFAGGYVHDERRFCRMPAPDRIEVTSADLPEGALVEVEESGYRIRPYRLLAKVGPLAFTLDAHDTHRMEGDTLVDTVELRWLVFPAARVEIRMDPSL